MVREWEKLGISKVGTTKQGGRGKTMKKEGKTGANRGGVDVDN